MTDMIQRRMRTDRSPVRKRRRSETALPAASRRRTSTSTASRCGEPRAWGHHRRGRSIVTDHSTVLAPAASVWSMPWSTPPTVVRTWASTPAAASISAVNDNTARSAVASVHRVVSRAIRTGPVSTRWTGRQIPPGFQSGSKQSQCWKTPVMFRLLVRSVCGEQASSTATVCSLRARTASVTSKLCGKKYPSVSPR